MPELLVTHKDEEIARYPLHRGTTNIGSSPNAEIQLSSPAINGLHARILSVGTEFHIQDLSTGAGTFVNDEQVQRTQLKHNDDLHIGNYRIRYLNEDAPAQPQRPAVATSQDPGHEQIPADDVDISTTVDPDVTPRGHGEEPSVGIDVLSGPNQGKRIDFSKSEVILASGSDQAALIESEHGTCSVCATDGNIGVTVNGAALEHGQSVELTNGDRIEFRDLSVRFFREYSESKATTDDQADAVTESRQIVPEPGS